MEFDTQVLQTITKFDLVTPGEKILVMVSGGKDSMALLHWLHARQANLQVDLAVFHLQHGLRGKAAQLDEQLVRDFSSALKLRYFKAWFPVRTLCRRAKFSLEEGARWIRYLTANLAACAWGADKIATAHTLDDQAETFLMRLLQGAGPGALAGIHPRLGKTIRPLLQTRAVQVLDYCRKWQLPFRDDASNLDLSLLRNKVRHCLIPFLEREFTPGLKTTLARSAEILRQEDAFLNTVAQRLFEAEGDCTPGQVSFKLETLQALPAVLQRRLLRLGIKRIKANLKDIGFTHIMALIDLLPKTSGKKLTLPGKLIARREFGQLVITRDYETTELQTHILEFPGCHELQDWNLRLEGRFLEPPVVTRPVSFWEAWLDADTLELPLKLRSRKDGDSFYPVGLGGKKKLKKLFMEKKIPLAHRKAVPVVIAGDEPVWIIGCGLDERFKVTPASRRILYLRAERLSKPLQA